MNRAETFQRRSSKCLDGAFVANIGWNGQRLDTPGSHAARRCLEGRLIQVGQHHAHPRRGETLSERQTNPARRSRNHRDLPRRKFHDSPLSGRGPLVSN